MAQQIGTPNQDLAKKTHYAISSGAGSKDPFANHPRHPLPQRQAMAHQMIFAADFLNRIDEPLG